MADALVDITAVDLFKAIAPHLEPSPADDSLINLYLDLAAQFVSANVFGPVYKTAVVYLAAHFKALDDGAQSSGSGGGATGPLIAERAGEVSVNYGLAAQGFGSVQDGLDNTVFGQRFKNLRRTRVGGKLMSTQRRTWPVPGANTAD